MSDLREELNKDDFKPTYKVAGNISSNPKRADIEALLTDNEVELPLPNNITFYILDENNHNFQVNYNKAEDAYFTISMSIAT